MDETIREILARANRPNDKIIFDDNPKRLVQRIIELVEKDKKAEKKTPDEK
jgi:hypothetical protein